MNSSHILIKVVPPGYLFTNNLIAYSELQLLLLNILHVVYIYYWTSIQIFLNSGSCLLTLV